MSQWKTVSTFLIQSKSIAPVEQPIGWYKQVKVTRLTEEDSSSRHFVDIRLYMDDNPTKIGLCLLPTEFKWVMSRLIRNKRSGKKAIGRREIMILKPNNWAISLRLCRPNRDPVEMSFSSRELKSLIELSSQIIEVINPHIDDFDSSDDEELISLVNSLNINQ